MKSKRKIIIAVAVLALISLLAWNALRQESGATVEVRVASVERRDLVARVSATGHIEAKSSVDITTDVAGRIVELPVEEGQDVREGDLLLVIDPVQYQTAVSRARASLSQARANEAQARANYEQASRDAQRLTELKSRIPDLVTDIEVEQAVTAASVQEALWRAAQHAVAQAVAARDQAADQLSKTVIRAPIDGRVTRLNVERGETAIVGTMNNPGSLLLTVSDLSTMEAVIEVDETDVPDIEIGDSTSVEIDAFANRAFAGRVTKIGNSSIRPRSQLTGSGSDQAIDFEVRITLDDPPPGVRPDLSATADVITDTRSNVLAIPITALTLMDAEEFEAIESELLEGADRAFEPGRDVEGVFVVEGDRVRFRPVRVGVAGEDHFEVLAGLDGSERVVSGSFQAIRDLKDGSRIRIVAADTARVEPSATARSGEAESDRESVEAAEAAPPEADLNAEPPRPAPPAGDAGTPSAGDEGGPRAGDASEEEVPFGFYAVVGSTPNSGGIRSLAASLGDAGYDTRVQRYLDEASETWYRALVGPFATRYEAEEAGRRLRTERGLEAWVQEVEALASGG